MIYALVALIILAAGVGYWFQAKQAEKVLNNTIGAYENSLAWERTRVDNLIVQVQANAQGMNHFPSFGPSEPLPEETRWLTDDTGLVQFEDDLPALEEV